MPSTDPRVRVLCDGWCMRASFERGVALRLADEASEHGSDKCLSQAAEQSPRPAPQPVASSTSTEQVLTQSSAGLPQQLAEALANHAFATVGLERDETSTMTLSQFQQWAQQTLCG